MTGRWSDVDVYPVGLLRELASFIHEPDRARARRALRAQLRTQVRRVRRREWRALRNWALNGYLAEPREFPPGLTRCGSGWTCGRAIRDLQRRIKEAQGWEAIAEQTREPRP